MKCKEQVADSVGGAAGEWVHQQMEVKESLSDWGGQGEILISFKIKRKFLVPGI